MYVPPYVHIYQPPSLKKNKVFQKKKKKKRDTSFPLTSAGGKNVMCCKKAIGCVFWGVGEVHDGRSLGGLRL